MKTIQTETDFKYTYSMKLGISEVRGGLKVLTDMNYPKEILGVPVCKDGTYGPHFKAFERLKEQTRL
jgi:hypothetical protein